MNDAKMSRQMLAASALPIGILAYSFRSNGEIIAFDTSKPGLRPVMYDEESGHLMLEMGVIDNATYAPLTLYTPREKLLASVRGGEL